MAIRWKQSQIYAGTDRLRSNAVTVKCGEAIAANDILCVATADTAEHGCMTVARAAPNHISKCRGPFFVADFGGASGDILPLAIPWKMIKSVNTSAAAQVGDAVWMAGAGGYTLGAVPAATGTTVGFSLAVKVGRVIKVHASEGVIMLDPNIATGAPMIGRVTLHTGGTTTVTGFTPELDGSPVVATPNGATGTHTTQVGALIAGGTLTLTSAGSHTDICTYMIHA